MDDQEGLNNFADEILTEQDRFKNHSKDWKSSLTIDHPSIQVVLGLALKLECLYGLCFIILSRGSSRDTTGSLRVYAKTTTC